MSRDLLSSRLGTGANTLGRDGSAVGPRDVQSRSRPATMPELLGNDLWTLLGTIGSAVVDAVPVTTIRWPGSPRASFRITLADGRVLKGRRFRTPADATRIARLTSLLDPRHFPPILAYRGCALLTAWIAGRAVAAKAWTSARLRTCGQLQGTIHRLDVPAEVAASEPPPRDWTERVDQWLAHLVAGAALGASEAASIRRLVAMGAPSTTRAGVCHTDFCADNVIITDAGQVCVIDNEGLSVDAPEFDLARTWYRWPMTARQQRAYAEGYGIHDHSARFEAHFLHWALMAVLDSAAYRIRAHPASVRIPLDRLAALLRTRGRNEAFPRILARGVR
jgi:hypothetical protein